MRVRRDGVEVRTKDIRVISPEGSTSVERRNVRQNQWTVTADKFRTLDRKEAVKDPTLAAAHSHLAVLERALERIFPGDRLSYDAILQVARERIVQHLEQGHTFARAEYSLPERTSDNENREHWPRQTEPERGKVRTRERER